jgi:hypothetical protein
MQEWYYVQSDQQYGPVSEPELVAMFADARLSPDTLVWTDGLADWTPARDMEGLVTQSHLPPPIPPPAPCPDSATAGSPPCPQVRPWIRWSARTLDVGVFALVGGLTVGFVFPASAELPDALFGVLVLFIYNFIEPAMFAAWGTTPGKALLRVSLRNQDGRTLTYVDALNRVLKVWIRGQGLGIPLVALFTQVNAYNKLTTNGITSWDQDASISVTHQAVEAWRVIACIVIFLVFLFIVAVGYAVE